MRPVGLIPWRAGCAETRTSGSESGQRKRIGFKSRHRASARLYTFIRLAAGFAYLAAILDACSRKVVGYALSQQIDTSFALAALNAAYAHRKPAPGTCIHHSDRGSQGGLKWSSQHCCL